MNVDVFLHLNQLLLNHQNHFASSSNPWRMMTILVASVSIPGCRFDLKVLNLWSWALRPFLFSGRGPSAAPKGGPSAGNTDEQILRWHQTLLDHTHLSNTPSSWRAMSFYDFNGTASSRTPHIGRQNSHTCCALRLQHLAHSLQMPRQLRFWMPSSRAIQHKKDKGCTLPPALYTSNHYFNGFFSHPSLLRELFKDVDPIKQSQLIPTKKNLLMAAWKENEPWMKIRCISCLKMKDGIHPTYPTILVFHWSVLVFRERSHIPPWESWKLLDFKQCQRRV